MRATDLTLTNEDGSCRKTSLPVGDRFLHQQLCNFVENRFRTAFPVRWVCEVGNLHVALSENQRRTTCWTKVSGAFLRPFRTDKILLLIEGNWDFQLYHNPHVKLEVEW